MLRRGAVVAAVLAVALASSPARSGKPKPPPPNNTAYQYISLGPGGANGMNDAGDVVGVFLDVVDGRQISRPFVAIFDGVYVRGDLNDWINPNSGVVLVSAGDINNSGQIAGTALFDVGGTLVEHACRLTPWIVDDDGYVIVKDLDADNPTRRSRGYVINDNGDVAGELRPYGEAFLYTDTDAGGVLLNLRSFATGLNQGISEFYISINNDAQVAGGSASANWVAWRFTPHFDVNGVIDGGVMQSLGLIRENPGGGGQSSGNDINDLGEVVGFSTAGGYDVHAYRYSDGAGMLDLGALGKYDRFDRSEAFGINNLGEVVGRDHKGARAFLYTDTFKMFELDSRINGLPAQLYGDLWPKRINDNGDICGNTRGAYNSNGEAFVLRRVAP